MCEMQLTLVPDTNKVYEATDRVADRLLKKFPEASVDLIHGLLLRALDERAILTIRTALGAGDNVVRFEVVLDSSRIFEVVAAALRTFDSNGVSHGQSFS